jgi:hypothetical protein
MNTRFVYAGLAALLLALSGCTSLTTVTLGLVPPTISATARIFSGIAVSAKTITIRTPYPGLYSASVSPWTDKIDANNITGYFWDNTDTTKDNLTVALTSSL